MIISIFIIGIYLGYKLFYLAYFNLNHIQENSAKNIKITDTITIKHQLLSENEYLTWQDIRVKNSFQDFKQLEQNNSLKLVAPKIKTSFWLGSWYTNIELLKSEKEAFMNDKRLKTTDVTDFLNKKKITNDIELLKYLSKKEKNTIFTSVKEMEQKYALYTFMSTILPETKEIYLIDGDYQGYLLHYKNNMSEACILKNNKRYIFTFVNQEYFTQNKIKDILNTLEIV